MADAASLAHALKAVRSGRQWKALCPCHEDRSPSLIIFEGRTGAVQVRCMAGCGQRDLINALRDRGLWERSPDQRIFPRAEKPTATVSHEKDRADIARYLWSQRQPIAGTLAEHYLRKRGITCPLPATLGFLPTRNEHPRAMIAAFGIPQEIESGVLQMRDQDVVAVHLTKLEVDGRKIEKIMVGSPGGAPIVLAPMNDLLGLAIAEGIEDALSVHCSTGLGAWAAGSASLLGMLGETVPDYADCVSVFVDNNDAGRRHSEKLINRLVARGIGAWPVLGRVT